MIKTLLTLEISKESRKYQLILSQDSPLGEIFDVITEMRSFVLHKINDAVKTEQPEQIKND